MYSYKDRIRAVELYINSGSGLPPPFVSWVTQPGKLSRAGVGNTNNVVMCRPAIRLKPKYSDEQKAVAVAHYLRSLRCSRSSCGRLYGPNFGNRLLPNCQTSRPRPCRAIRLSLTSLLLACLLHLSTQLQHHLLQIFDARQLLTNRRGQFLGDPVGRYTDRLDEVLQ